MTKKRFNCEVTDTDLCHIETITDNFEMNTFDDVKTVTELLNKFSEENKELKQSISDWQGSYDELYEDNLKLEKENKELKKLIKKTLETTPMEHNLAVELKNNVREFYD